VDLLAGHLHIGRSGRLTGTRELVVSGTPYIIPYRVKEDRLELIAVFHGHQKWPKRL
jgi:plasmid stabilization system protein ParE